VLKYLYNGGVRVNGRGQNQMREWLGRCLLILGLVVSGLLPIYGGAQSSPVPRDSKEFHEQDARQVMEGIRKSFEANNRNRLIGLFDSKRMPEFAAFRDQVSQLFVQYESFQVRYHVDQISQEGEFGSIVAEFVLQAVPVSDRQADLRRRTQLHLIVAWDGTTWKIADISPRTVFE
jgi:hypothetical protein